MASALGSISRTIRRHIFSRRNIIPDLTPQSPRVATRGLSSCQMYLRRGDDELIQPRGRLRQLQRLHSPTVMLQGTPKWGLARDIAGEPHGRRVETRGHGDLLAFLTRE